MRPAARLMAESQRYTFDRVVRLAISGALIAGLLVLLRHLSDVLIPFVAAVVLAYLLNPLVTAFEHKTGRRGTAVAITLVGLGVVGAALVTIIVPIMFLQCERVGRDVGRFYADLTASLTTPPAGRPHPAASAPDRVAEPGSGPAVGRAPGPAAPPTIGMPAAPGAGAPAEPTSVGGLSDAPDASRWGWAELRHAWPEFLRRPEDPDRFATLHDAVAGTYVGDIWDAAVGYTQTEEFDKLVVDLARRLAIGGGSAVAYAVHVLLGMTGFIIVLLYLVFLLVDYPTYARQWREFLPPAYRDAIVGFLGEFDAAMRRYFRGQAVIALLMGVLFAIGFSLIGLPLAVPFGLFIGALNMVPYLQAVGLIPGMLLAVLRSVETSSSLTASVLWVLAVFVVAQIIQDALITPRVMGQATGLKPVAILLGVFIWGKLLGFLGLLLAIPLTCVGIAYYRRWILNHTAGDV